MIILSRNFSTFVKLQVRGDTIIILEYRPMVANGYSRSLWVIEGSETNVALSPRLTDADEYSLLILNDLNHTIGKPEVQLT
mgnify:CR=1 FL=1